MDRGWPGWDLSEEESLGFPETFTNFAGDVGLVLEDQEPSPGRAEFRVLESLLLG